MPKRSNRKPVFLRLDAPERFYLIPLADVCALCWVSWRTALRWRQARALPDGARALLLLHARGQVVPAAWHGFTFDGDYLVMPCGRAISAGELRAYQYNTAMTREMLRKRRGLLEQLPLL